MRNSNSLRAGFHRGQKPRREWVADLVSRNDDAVQSLPIHVGSVSLLAVLINRGVLGIPPDASRAHENGFFWSCRHIDASQFWVVGTDTWSCELLRE
ncbi:protein COFACTOR ASSEMBLY OF COMPLEX C SUBUNIT B CCB4, chloroplastic-like [Rhododendron vialii]|uniref:protein COFACTOR ASSEMBLY OF COMPLEX C SUBUNIT B CCB4, chloroplastic-like n=1 Tax=Rhododendron vialii TaxID=182163 RepID=UPI00265ED7B7|nr:protein COFACTOR ASSEMBLY OF COMPLEX C SUBUNIT B CCB4, chloroplastic-like [Rhododendron vialii]